MTAVHSPPVRAPAGRTVPIARQAVKVSAFYLYLVRVHRLILVSAVWRQNLCEKTIIIVNQFFQEYPRVSRDCFSENLLVLTITNVLKYLQSDSMRATSFINDATQVSSFLTSLDRLKSSMLDTFSTRPVKLIS